MRGVTQYHAKDNNYISISTHTPHARRDFMGIGIFAFFIRISTHTPHARRDNDSTGYD